MKEIIQQYWISMFGEYIVCDDSSELNFSLPGFPEPLMSPRFIRGKLPSKYSHLNLISEDSVDGFYLHVFVKGEGHKEEINYSSEPLSKAILRNEFWSFQEKSYSNSYPFIKRLLPFLALHNTHHHIFLGTPEKIIASVIVGETKNINFLFNASVDEDFRNLGLMKMLFNSILARFTQNQSFYWTIHPWLSLNAASSLKYRVLKAPLIPVN